MNESLNEDYNYYVSTLSLDGHAFSLRKPKPLQNKQMLVGKDD